MIGLAMMLVAAAAPTFTLTKTDVHAISKQCHTPANWIVVRPDRSVHFKPAATAPYKRVSCVARALRKRGGPIAFVGDITP